MLALLLIAFAITARADPVLRYMNATVANLRDPGVYVAGVRAAAPAIPGEGRAP